MIELLIILYNKDKSRGNSMRPFGINSINLLLVIKRTNYLFLPYESTSLITSQQCKKYFHPEKIRRIFTNLQFFSIACKYHYTKPIRSILRIIQHRDRLFNYDMYTVHWGRVHIWSDCNHRIYRSI